MSVLLSSLGWTPAVVTEVIDLLEGKGIKIDEVVVFPTKDIIASYYALVIDFKYGPYQEKKKIEKYDLPFHDIENEQDCEKFREIIENVINEKEKEGRNVIISVAGGRKTMPLDLMLVASRKNIKVVYHVIAKEKKGISNEFAGIQKIFNFKALVERNEAMPKEILNFIVDMCHPKDLTLKLIQIPTK